MIRKMMNVPSKPARPVIFLDIDGVLCWGNPGRYSIKSGIAEKKADELENPAIAGLGDQLVSSILGTFNNQACSLLAKLCEEYHAEIVLTSSWRLLHSLEDLQAIFSLIGAPCLSGCVAMGSIRRDVIRNYLNDHRIDHYIVIDDMDLSRVFGYRFIHCFKGFGLPEYKQASSALMAQRPVSHF